VLSQDEADFLMSMEKRFVPSPPTISLLPGADLTYELTNEINRERFLLDLGRSAIRLSKVKFQTRARKTIVLARLDINGAPHTNPDGIRIGGTHLHIYREGFETKWAYPLDRAQFPNLTDIAQTLEDFCQYCNILDSPSYQIELI